MDCKNTPAAKFMHSIQSEHTVEMSVNLSVQYFQTDVSTTAAQITISVGVAIHSSQRMLIM